LFQKITCFQKPRAKLIFFVQNFKSFPMHILQFISQVGVMVFFPPKVPICPFLHFFFEKSVSELIVVHTRVERRINCLLVQELCVCGPSSTFDGPRSVFMTQLLMFWPTKQPKKGHFHDFFSWGLQPFCAAQFFLVFWGKNYGGTGKSQFAGAHAVSTTQDWYRYGVTTYNHGGRTHFSTIHFISCFSVARQMVRRSSNF